MADTSEVIKFFTNKTIFLTGGTGFVGKLTLERLLRVYRVGMIYMLVRPKKGKCEADRFQDLFATELFQRMREECPDYQQHVKMIQGNCIGKNLDISDKDWILLHEEVEVIIHCAATVRFDQQLRVAYHINVRASRDLIVQARQMKKLKSFIYVSTAYSNCMERTIEERIYAPPMTAEQLEAFLNTFPDNKFISKMEKSILQDIPNTYTYTKCVSEEMVSRLAKDPQCPLPLSIVRPSIILSTYKQPIPGFIDNVYGPLGVTQSVAIGLMRTLHCIPEGKADMVPGDYVVSALLAVAWKTAQNGPHHQNPTDTKEVEVYNYTSGENSIDWNTYMKLNHKEGNHIVPMIAIWKPLIFLNRYLFVHNLCWFLMHTIPAHLVDTGLKIMGKKPFLVSGYKKLTRFADAISYFSSREWSMPHAKILKLYDELPEGDKKLLEIRISTFNWSEYAKDYIRGGRWFLLHEPISNLKESRKRFRWVLLAYYSLNTFLVVLGAAVLNWVLGWFGCNLV